MAIIHIGLVTEDGLPSRSLEREGIEMVSKSNVRLRASRLRRDSPHFRCAQAKAGGRGGTCSEERSDRQDRARSEPEHP